jgi:hypothetical protein
MFVRRGLHPLARSDAPSPAPEHKALERLETWPYDNRLPPNHPATNHQQPVPTPDRDSAPPAVSRRRPQSRRVEMNTTTARDRERSALAAETRTSALLLGGALGSMGLIAFLLLFLTSGWPGT